jgi:carbamoyl-phosphate synthase large subunit
LAQGHLLSYSPAVCAKSLGFHSTELLASFTLLLQTGVNCESVFKISEGRPNPSDLLRNGDVTMMMITSTGDEPDLRDGKDLRRLALSLQVRLSLVVT